MAQQKRTTQAKTKHVKTNTCPAKSRTNSANKSRGTASHTAHSRSQRKTSSANTSRARSTKTRSHNMQTVRHVCKIAAWVCGSIAMLGSLARLLPSSWQAIPLFPELIAVCPWFMILAVIACVCAVVAQQWCALALSLAVVIVQCVFQFPFYHSHAHLTQAARNGVGMARFATDDPYARVMTCNVYKGQANAEQIVEIVRDQRVEVLALQETTAQFIERLKDAGIEHWLPYSITASADGVFGNAIFAGEPLTNTQESDIDSSASYMPAGTIDIGGHEIRFVSVHTTSPTLFARGMWKTSLDELQEFQTRSNMQYVLMGDFNATYDHKPFRDVLGSRFEDAVESAGHGPRFTWPANNRCIPSLSGIDHILVEKGVVTGQITTPTIEGSDHKALIATLDFSALPLV